MIARLATALNDACRSYLADMGTEGDNAREIIRAMIEKIVIIPGKLAGYWR